MYAQEGCDITRVFRHTLPAGLALSALSFSSGLLLAPHQGTMGFAVGASAPFFGHYEPEISPLDNPFSVCMFRPCRGGPCARPSGLAPARGQQRGSPLPTRGWTQMNPVSTDDATDKRMFAPRTRFHPFIRFLSIDTAFQPLQPFPHPLDIPFIRLSVSYPLTPPSNSSSHSHTLSTSLSSVYPFPIR